MRSWGQRSAKEFKSAQRIQAQDFSLFTKITPAAAPQMLHSTDNLSLKSADVLCINKTLFCASISRKLSTLRFIFKRLKIHNKFHISVIP